MNRQYKVIWSKVKHCYIVVSELVKRNGKSSSVKSKSGQKIGVTLAVLALCFGISGTTLAADLTADQQAVYDAVIEKLQLGEGPGVTIGDNSSTTMDTSVAIGTNANATGNSPNTAVGWNATATGIGHSAAYGTNSKALGESALAVGPEAEAYGKAGIAIGNAAISNTETLTESSIAIGDRAEAKSNGSIGIGIKTNATGKRSMSMGIQTQATGNYSMAIGGYTSAEGEDSMAFGHNAVATKHSSVALGAKSVADRGYDTYGYAVDHAAFKDDTDLLTYLGKIDEYNAAVDIVIANQKDYKEKDAAWRADRSNEELRLAAEQANAKFVASQQSLLKLTAAYKSYFGAVSVGTDFATRQIINVAAGTEDTDAVNVAQLKALNNKVDANKIEYVSINSTYEENKANDGATEVHSVAIGPQAGATSNSAIAIGRNAQASGSHSAAYGPDTKAMGQSSLAMGNYSVAELKNSTALGAFTNGIGTRSLAVGSHNVAAGHDSVAIGYGSLAFNGYINKDTYNALSPEEQEKYFKPSGVEHYFLKEVTNGNNIVANYLNTAVGSYARAFKHGVALGGISAAVENGTAIGTSAKVKAQGAVSLGYNTRGNVENGVALGAHSIADREKGEIGYTLGGDNSTIENAMESIGQKARYDELNAIINPLKDEYNVLYDAYWNTSSGSAEEADAKQKLDAWNAEHPDYLSAVNEQKQLISIWQSENGAVSVGSAGFTRQITNVAAGSEDTDAVNVAQLKALNTKVDTNKIEYVSIKSSVEENKANEGATGEDSIAIGPNASATKDAAVAIGKNVTANGGVAIGENASSSASNSVAIGLGAIAGNDLQSDVAIGSGSKAAGYSVAIGNGASSYMDPNPEFGDGSGLGVAVGGSATVTGPSGVAVGFASEATFEANALGASAKATGRGAISIGDTTKASGAGSVVLGNRAEADSTFGIAIGTYTKGLGSSSIGIGGETEATGNWSMAVGRKAIASADLSTSVGPYSNVNSEKSTALGSWASAEDGSYATAVGYYARTRAGKSVALGSYSTASGGASMALGYDSASSGGASTALGYKAASNVNNGVALGSYSVADRAGKVYGYNVDGVGFASDEDVAAYIGKSEAYQAATADFEAKLAVYNEKEAALNADPTNEQLQAEYKAAGAATQASYEARDAIVAAYRSTLGAISVGSAVDTRQITNVAAGSQDTDAVNVAQLKGLKTLVDTKTENLEDNSKGYFHANMKEATDPSWNNYGLMSDTGGAGGYYSVAAGIEAQVSKDAEKGVAIGYRTKTKQKSGIAIGYDTVSDGERAVAIGQDAKAEGIDATALGFNAQALNSQSLALGNQSKATGGWSVAIGQDTNSSGELSFAGGYGAESSGYGTIAMGLLSGAYGQASSAYGWGARASGVAAVAIGPGANARGNDSITMGRSATAILQGVNGIALGQEAYIGNKRAATDDSDLGVPDLGVPDNNLVVEQDDTKPSGTNKEYMNSIAIGVTAKSFGFQNTVLGAGAEAHDSNSVAIGVATHAVGHHTTAIGKQADARGKEATALGHWARAYGDNTIAIGSYAITNTLDGTGSIENGIAIGQKARVGSNNSVAIGQNSLAYINDDVVTKAYLTEEMFAKENGVVSVGNAEYTIGETTVEANRRRITNVAGGASDYDAVNVAQLQAVEEEGLNFKGDGNTVVHRDLGTELTISGGNTDITTLTDGNIGVVADKVDGSLKVKLAKSLNLADGSVSFAETAKDEKGNALVKGEDGKWYTDLTDAVYDADNQTYTKDGEIIAAIKSPVVSAVKLTSAGLNNGNQRITNVAAGVDGTDAVNMSQLTALNTKVDSNKIEYVSIKSSVEGNKANDGATGTNAIAIGPNAKATAYGSIGVGSGQQINKEDPASEYKKVDSQYGVAIGYTSVIDDNSTAATATGYQSEISNSEWASAYGAKAKVDNSLQGTAIGQSASVSGSAYGTALGTFANVKNSDSGIAIGSMANVNNAPYGMAIGVGSSVTNQGGTALGYGTAVSEKSGVALGLGSVANRRAEVYGYSPDGVTFTDDASIAAYLGKTAEFESANQEYAEKFGVYQEKLTAYQQDPNNRELLQQLQVAAVDMAASFEKRTSIISAYKSSYGAVAVGSAGATRQIINVAAGTEDSDAVNLAQLKTVEQIAKAHTEITLDGAEATAGANGELGKYIGENNLTMAVKDVDGQKVYDLKLKNEVVIGKPGKDGKDGEPGKIGLVGPAGPAGEDGQPGKNAYGEISVKNGVDGVNGTNGKDGMTRIVYVDERDKEHTVATLEDGLKFAGDTENVTIAKKLNETLAIKGGISNADLLSDNNIGVVADKGLTIKLAKNLNLADGSVAFAETMKDAEGNVLVKGEDGKWYTDLTDAVYDADSQTYTKDGAALTAVTSPVVSAVKLSSTGLDNGNQRIVNVATGIDKTDAVNVEQLDKAISKVSSDVGGAHTELTLDGAEAIAGADGKLGDYIGENNLTMAVKDVNGQKVYDLKLKNEVVIGKPGKDGKDGTPGSIGLVGPAGPKGEDGQPGKNAYGEISVKNGADGVDGTNGKDGMTRIVYVDERDKEHTVATLEDGLKFAGDTENVTIAKKLNETLDIKGGINDANLLTDNNIGVVADKDKGLTVKLAKNLNLSDGSVAFAETARDAEGNALVKGEDGKWYTDLTDAVYDADSQTYTKDGATLTSVATPIVSAVKLSSTGLDNGNQRIVNVATGIDGTDAVNVSQLKKEISDVKTSVGGAHTELTLDGKEAKAGANEQFGAYIGENNLTMAVKEIDGQKVYDLKLKNEVVIGKPGKDGKDGEPGKIGLVGPAGPKGEDGQQGKNAYGEISVKNGVDGVDGENGKDGMTRIVYVDERDREHTLATLEDGLKFAGDTTDVTIAKKLNETLNIKGGISDANLLTDNNIGVVADKDKGLTVKLAKNLNLSDGSVTITSDSAKDDKGKWLVKGEDGNWYTNLKGAVYDANTQTYTKDGVTLTAVSNPVMGVVKLSAAGLDNGNQRIINVAPGKADTDAVNLAQLRQIANKPEHHNRVTVYGKSAEPGENGQHGPYVKNHNLTMGVKEVNGELIHDIQLSKFVDLEEGQLTFTPPKDKNNPTFRQASDTGTTKVTLSAAGLDSGNQRIINVADGVDDKDAVNVSQLKANKVSLTEGTNVKITSKSNDDGSTDYTIASTDTITGLTNTTWAPTTTGIVSGRAATEDQLKAAISNVTEAVGGAHTELTLDGQAAKAGANEQFGDYIGENNLTMAVKEVSGQKVYDLRLKNEVVIGKPGKDGKDGTPGSIGLVGPAGPKGEDGQPGKNAYGEISVKNGADGVDGENGKDGMTRIVYVDERDKEHTLATLEDGLKFAGDTTDVTIAKKLNETLNITGGISNADLLSDNNIGVVADKDKGLTVKLAKNLNLNDGSVRIGGTTNESGVAAGGIYIANQKGVPTTKDGKTEDGLFITGLDNTDWDPDTKGIVETRAATEKQLKSVADSSARIDASNLNDANVTSWKTKLGITDTLLSEAGAWKLTVNSAGERSIKKDSVINFVNGEKVQITQKENDITVGLDAEFVKQVTDNTTNITNLDNRVTKVEGDVTNVKQDITKINNDITNINTKIENIEGKAGVANVVGDEVTGVKVEQVDANDATKGVKVSLEDKITVGGITIDGTTPSEGEAANRTITGLTNTTWDAEKAVDDRAATEGQLKDLSEKIKDIGEIKDGVRTYASDDSADQPLKRKNSEAMELRGGADSDKLSDKNIGVVTNEQKTGFDIKLAKNLKGLDSAEIGNVSISNNITVGTGDKKTVITDNSVTTGNTTINNNGLTIVNEDSSKNITIQNNNVNMGGNAIHNVGEAVEENDAVNKGQFDRTISTIGAGMNEMSGRIGKLDRRVDRVGAGAAALAALHPLEYSPDAKWEVTAGIGKYGSANAVAVGAFYRPNYDTLFSIGASYGGGENLVNAGVTWRIGEGETKNYPSKQVMAQEINTLKSALVQQNDKIEAQSEQLEAQNRKIEELLQAMAALTK